MTKKIKTVPRTSFSCPVERISGVWCFERSAGQRTTARSTPGHLLHCHFKGTTELQANGRNYIVTPNSVIYYHESEEVKNYFVNDIMFYSIAFQAPNLGPLPLNRRVFKVEPDIVDIFKNIYNVYSSNPPDAAMQLYTMLLSLLPRIGFTGYGIREYHTAYEKLWLEVEAWINRNHKYRASSGEICRHFNVSAATLLRACQETLETSVSKRIRQMRMAEARALLLYSGLNISETAEYLGYPRMHEFSREFSAYFKFPASKLLKRNSNSIKQTST